MSKEINKKIVTSNIFIGILFFFLGTLSVGYPPLKGRQSNNFQADLSLFWNVWNIMDEKYPFDEPSSDEKIFSAIEGLVNSYDDPYSQFLLPVESEFFSQTVSGVFAGIGAEITIRNGFLTVISPLKDSPAEQSGLQPGDVITHVDGYDISGETLGGGISKIRGKQDSTVVLTIFRVGEAEPRDVEVTRKVVTIPVLKSEIIDDIFIIHLYNFNELADDAFRKTMNDFKESGLTKILIDVRNNPGGYLSASIDMASYFLPQGTVVLREHFGDEKSDTLYRSLGYDLITGINPQIIILQNNGSASASEIVAGALSDNGVAKIAGEQSYGKGSVQQLIELPQSTALKVTIAKWLTPNGDEISEIGISPDYEIPSDFDSLEDTQLQEALTLFN
jgi:carboxyl-terminal processing protease